MLFPFIGFSCLFRLLLS